MKLYLSSQGFGNHLSTLQKMVGSDKRVLFINNAKDGSAPDERAAHTEQKRGEFKAAGFEFFELDLRDYFRSPDTLRPIVMAAPFVWVSGGNTFVLRRAFSYSGFDTIINMALKQTGITYGGSSAGSIIMTKTLEGVEHGDDPAEVPDGYRRTIIWDGLGLIYPQLIPHVGSEGFGRAAEAMSTYYDDVGLHYVTLRDGEVYVVDGSDERKLS